MFTLSFWPTVHAFAGENTPQVFFNPPPRNKYAIVFPYGEEIRCDQCYGVL